MTEARAWPRCPAGGARSLRRRPGVALLEQRHRRRCGHRQVVVVVDFLHARPRIANLFFQRISRPYERGPMILTSNQSFGAWGEVFGDLRFACCFAQ